MKKLFFFILVLWWGLKDGAAQSDLCSGATPISVNSSCVTTAYSVGAAFGTEAATPSCTGTSIRDGYFSFVATSTITTVTATTNRNLAIVVYSNSCPAAGAEVACANDFGSGFTETTTFTTVPGTTYYIRLIRTQGTAANAMTGNICVYSPVTTTTCSATFFDSGGSGGNYGNDENSIWIYCPSTPGQCITANFTSFSMETGLDYLYVYEGNNLDGNFLGAYTGTSSPGSFSASTLTSNGCLTFQFISDGSITSSGWQANISCGTCNAPTNYFVSCGTTFYDSGGSGGDYSTYETQMYTYCPATPGQCISAEFQVFETENGIDELYIFDGNSLSSPLIGAYSGTSSPGTIIGSSTNSSGCLTFLWFSDGSIEYAGWQVAITCETCGTTPALPSSDCGGGTTVCNSSSFTGNSSGYGTQELPNNNTIDGCLTDENQSSWYLFQVQTAGTFAFTIAPANGTDDYDFALWGPYTTTTCPPNTSPVRCSFSGVNGNTGLLAGAGDNSEGIVGDSYVNPITANVGEIYILLIDNFSSTTSPFTLTWNMTGGASLDCNVVLPVEMSQFTAYHANSVNIIEWTTLTEVNSHHFTVERSTDGIHFEVLETLPAAGNSNGPIRYQSTDYLPNYPITYYRIKETDANGEEKVFPILAVDLSKGSNTMGEIIPNPNEGLFSLNLQMDASSSVAIEVFDISGKQLSTEHRATVKGENKLDFNATDYAVGVYYVVITAENGNVLGTKKLIISR
jgi:hypothetical protein